MMHNNEVKHTELTLIPPLFVEKARELINTFDNLLISNPFYIWTSTIVAGKAAVAKYKAALIVCEKTGSHAALAKAHMEVMQGKTVTYNFGFYDGMALLALEADDQAFIAKNKIIKKQSFQVAELKETINQQHARIEKQDAKDKNRDAEDKNKDAEYKKLRDNFDRQTNRTIELYERLLDQHMPKTDEAKAPPRHSSRSSREEGASSSRAHSSKASQEKEQSSSRPYSQRAPQEKGQSSSRPPSQQDAGFSEAPHASFFKEPREPRRNSAEDAQKQQTRESRDPSARSSSHSPSGSGSNTPQQV